MSVCVLMRRGEGKERERVRETDRQADILIQYGDLQTHKVHVPVIICSFNVYSDDKSRHSSLI